MSHTIINIYSWKGIIHNSNTTTFIVMDDKKISLNGQIEVKVDFFPMALNTLVSNQYQCQILLNTRNTS